MASQQDDADDPAWVRALVRDSLQLLETVKRHDEETAKARRETLAKTNAKEMKKYRRREKRARENDEPFHEREPKEIQDVGQVLYKWSDEENAVSEERIKDFGPAACLELKDQKRLTTFQFKCRYYAVNSLDAGLFLSRLTAEKGGVALLSLSHIEEIVKFRWFATRGNRQTLEAFSNFVVHILGIDPSYGDGIIPMLVRQLNFNLQTDKGGQAVTLEGGREFENARILKKECRALMKQYELNEFLDENDFQFMKNVLKFHPHFALNNRSVGDGGNPNAPGPGAVGGHHTDIEKYTKIGVCMHFSDQRCFFLANDSDATAPFEISFSRAVDNIPVPDNVVREMVEKLIARIASSRAHFADLVFDQLCKNFPARFNEPLKHRYYNLSMMKLAMLIPSLTQRILKAVLVKMIEIDMWMGDQEHQRNKTQSVKQLAEKAAAVVEDGQSQKTAIFEHSDLNEIFDDDDDEFEVMAQKLDVCMLCVFDFLEKYFRADAQSQRRLEDIRRASQMSCLAPPLKEPAETRLQRSESVSSTASRFDNDAELDNGKQMVLYFMLALFRELFLERECRTHNVQYIFFYLCSLSARFCHDFLRQLMKILYNSQHSTRERIGAANFVGSIFARAKFLSLPYTVKTIRYLIEWCVDMLPQMERTLRVQDYLEAKLALVDSLQPDCELFFLMVQNIAYIMLFHADAFAYPTDPAWTNPDSAADKNSFAAAEATRQGFPCLFEELWFGEGSRPKCCFSKVLQSPMRPLLRIKEEVVEELLFNLKRVGYRKGVEVVKANRFLEAGPEARDPWWGYNMWGRTDDMAEQFLFEQYRLRQSHSMVAALYRKYEKKEMPPGGFDSDCEEETLVCEEGGAGAVEVGDDLPRADVDHDAASAGAAGGGATGTDSNKKFFSQSKLRNTGEQHHDPFQGAPLARSSTKRTRSSDNGTLEALYPTTPGEGPAQHLDRTASKRRKLRQSSGPSQSSDDDDDRFADLHGTLSKLEQNFDQHDAPSESEDAQSPNLKLTGLDEDMEDAASRRVSEVDSSRPVSRAASRRGSADEDKGGVPTKFGPTSVFDQMLKSSSYRPGNGMSSQESGDSD